MGAAGRNAALHLLGDMTNAGKKHTAATTTKDH